MPHHDSFFKEEKSKFPLTNQGGGRNLCGRTIVKIREFFVNEILGKQCHLLPAAISIDDFTSANLTIELSGYLQDCGLKLKLG
jgi:hypothetical protein